MNKAESDSVRIQLNQLNWEPAECEDDATLVLLNTCSVRKTAEDRIWGRIGRFKYLKQIQPELKLVVMGCMAERLKDKFLEEGVVDLVIGNFEKHRMAEMLEETFSSSVPLSFTDNNPYQFLPQASVTAGSFKAFLPIMHGCNNWCAYCIVPHVRGREISREPEQIFSEISSLEKAGIIELTLLGQNVNSYLFPSAGKNIDFPALLQKLANRITRIQWIRFLTSHPKDISPQLGDVIADNPLFCKHVHLPVQHGSDRILEAMGRGYTREKYLSLVHRIREQIPGVSLTTDLLVGFPGEEERDYQDTLDLMQEVRFNAAYTYRYNPREGTRAYAMGDTVPEHLKLERLSQLIAMQQDISREERTKQLGSLKKVLVEGVSKKNGKELLGRTESDEMVVFPGNRDRIGKFITLRLEGLVGNTFQAKEEQTQCHGD